MLCMLTACVHTPAAVGCLECKQVTDPKLVGAIPLPLAISVDLIHYLVPASCPSRLAAILVSSTAAV